MNLAAILLQKRLVALIVVLAIIRVTADDEVFPALYKPSPTKVVGIGWDNPDAKELRENIREIEKSFPGSGMAIRLNTKVVENGKEIIIKNNHMLRPGPAWKKKWLEPFVNDLRAAKSDKLTDNFILTATNPGNVDWFEDEEWKLVCERFATVAWAAKEGDCRGIILDCEDYNGRHLFHYSHDSDHSFPETWNKVRQRGQELVTALCGEYPDIKIFTFFWLGGLCGVQDLQAHNEGLLVAFANGIYDKLNPRAEVIDGYETGYTLSHPGDFFQARKNFDYDLKYLCHPENVRTFRTQTTLAIPMYIDSYVNRAGRWQKEIPENLTRLDFFKRNLSLAMKNSGEYIWLYGEQGKWWNKEYNPGTQGILNNTYGKGRHWEEIMPGITGAVDYAREPLKFALEDLKNGKFDKNLVKNGSFEDEFRGWSTFAPGMKHRDRAKAKHGEFAVRMCNSNDLALKQDIRIQAGKAYLARALWRTMQAGKAFVAIRAYDGNGTELKEIKLLDGGNSGEWGEVASILRLPEGSEKICVELREKSETAAYLDRCYFDDVGIYELPTAFKSLDTEQATMNKALQALSSGALGKNLVENGDFELDDAVSGWQSVKSGDFISASEEMVDGKYSGLLRYMKRATLRQVIPVKPLESFLFRAYCKMKGKVSPEVYIQWKNQDNEWTKQHVRFSFDEKLANGWRGASKIIEVPPGIGYLGLHVIMVSATSSMDNMCYFDNIGLYNLKEPSAPADGKMEPLVP